MAPQRRRRRRRRRRRHGWIESVGVETSFQLADLFLIVGQVDQGLKVFPQRISRVDRVAAVGVQVHRTLGDGVIEKHNDGDDVIVGGPTLTHVGHRVTGHQVAHRASHQFDTFGRNLQRDFGRFAFFFLLLQVSATSKQPNTNRLFQSSACKLQSLITDVVCNCPALNIHSKTFAGRWMTSFILPL